MSFLKKLGEFVVEYFFMVVAGMLFVFFVGFLYATVVRPAGIFFSIFFFLMAVGWIVYLIGFFWDVLERQKKERQ